MRVTDRSNYMNFLNGLERTREDLSRAGEQLSDGKRVRRVSDDPAQAPIALALRGRLAALDGYDRSAASATTDLNTIDQALSEVSNILSSARAEATAGASGTAPNGNEARAARIDALRAQLLSVANVQQGGRYLFAGTATQTQAFLSDGTYQGNTTEAEAPVDTNETVASTVSGQRAFKDGGDLFARLADLASALREGRLTDVASAASSLRGDIDRIGALHAEIGARLSTLDAVQQRHGDESTRLTGRISQIEDADLATAAVQLQQAQTSQSALAAAAAKSLGRSLFDYLG
jgi:flagellar hook-associated protein 3 FlgL